MVQSLADELTRVVDLGAVELRAIDATLAASKQKPEAWSVKQIVGHLIDSASNNHQRFVRAQHTRELSFPSYEQDAWVLSQDHQARPWRELVDFWVLYNHHLAHVIRRIPDAATGVSCRIGTGEPITLSALVEGYVAHVKHHLMQIQERRASTAPGA